jgi:hypothetical protein
MRNVFERLVGDAFEQLPATVQRLHRATGDRAYLGEVQVERGSGPLSRLCGWATRLPPAGQASIRVRIASTPGREVWSRHVAGHVMTSSLRAHHGLLEERLGLVTFGFELSATGDGLSWTVRRVRALGVPLPARLFRRVQARESERGGRYAFHVVAALPIAGLLVDYRGLLDVD